MVGDRIFVVGGWGLNGRGGERVWHDSALELDLSQRTPQWKEVGQPFRRRAFTLAAFDGKLYAVGGLSDAELEADVHVFDPEAGEWTAGPKLPGNRRNAFSPAACEVGGRLVVNPSDGTLYRLNDAGDGWDAVGTVRHNRMVHRMVPFDGKAVVVGGASREGNVAAVEVAEPAGE